MVFSDRTSAPTMRAGDIAPLTERLEHLQTLRVAFALLVMIASATAVVPKGVSAEDLTTVSLCYLVLTACVETLRRIGGKRYLVVVGAMLLLDGVYLAFAIYLTGITTSPFGVLVYLHLIATTLLASYRTALKLAAWHSLLLLVAFYADLTGVHPPIEAASGASFDPILALNITAYWLVAVGTAAYSSLNERELRRHRSHLEALAELARELETSRNANSVAMILLQKVTAGLGFERGLVLTACGGEVMLAASSQGTPASLIDHPGIDSVITRSWEEKSILLVRVVDPIRDPGLNEALPGARNLLIAPMFAEGSPIGALVAEFGGRPGGVTTRTVSMVSQFTAHAGLALQNAWLVEQLRELAETDPLTAIANRRTFTEALEHELARASRNSEQVALVMLDLDHFKRYNDTHGHQAGDELLRAASGALREVSREYDTVARYGGEEFAVILPACDPAKAQELGNRLRESVCRIEALVPVTASAGVAVFPVHAGNPLELIKAADDALYRSKRLGRDRVSVAVERGETLVSSA